MKVPFPDTKDNVYFVDTPGFDDTEKSDVEILGSIAEFLIERWVSFPTLTGLVIYLVFSRYRNTCQKLTGILYLHRISDIRMAGSSLKQLRVFADMCGRRGLPNVVLVTTMWTGSDYVVACNREDELRTSFWKPLIDRGSSVARFDGTVQSAWEIVKKLQVQTASPLEVPQGVQVLLTEEIVEKRLELNETSSGITLQKELERLLKAQQEASKKLAELCRRPEGNVDAIQVEQSKLQADIQKIGDQVRRLKISWKRRVAAIFVHRPEVNEVYVYGVVR